jgi:hypothetical protein
MARIMDLLSKGSSSAFVSPQSWNTIKSYKHYREFLIEQKSFRLSVDLGINSFRTSMYQFNVALTILSNEYKSGNHGYCINLSKTDTIVKKFDGLKVSGLLILNQPASVDLSLTRAYNF